MIYKELDRGGIFSPLNLVEQCRKHAVIAGAELRRNIDSGYLSRSLPRVRNRAVGTSSVGHATPSSRSTTSRLGSEYSAQSSTF